MSTENDKGLDDLFKNKLEDPVNDAAGYNEGDWDAMEQMLDKHHKPKGVVYWLPLLSAAAALLLLFLGWWFLQPKPGHNEALSHVKTMKKQQPANITPGSDAPGTKKNEIKQQAAGTTSKGVELVAKNGAMKQQPAKQGQKSSPAMVYAVNRSINKHGVISKSPAVLTVTNTTDTGNYGNTILKRQNNEILTAVSDLKIERHDAIIANPIGSVNLPKSNYPATGVSENGKIKVKPQATYRPSYALSVLAAPDVNGVGSFQQAKVGTNVGMLFSMGLSKKLTITTGALYSIKPYVTPFADYHATATNQFKGVTPVNVTADCSMLDIPLNVGYQVYNKHQNKISVGTGISSYIMLNENYQYNFASAYTYGPTSYHVPNSSNYFFGVLNLNATYEHQVNSKVGVSIEPYLKLPLTNIGYSQVKLQTTGVAVGLTWNLNSLTKP
jgi:hypothetical protein